MVSSESPSIWSGGKFCEAFVVRRPRPARSRRPWVRPALHSGLWGYPREAFLVLGRVADMSDSTRKIDLQSNIAQHFTVSRLARIL